MLSCQITQKVKVTFFLGWACASLSLPVTIAAPAVSKLADLRCRQPSLHLHFSFSSSIRAIIRIGVLPLACHVRKKSRRNTHFGPAILCCPLVGRLLTISVSIELRQTTLVPRSHTTAATPTTHTIPLFFFAGFLPLCLKDRHIKDICFSRCIVFSRTTTARYDVRTCRDLDRRHHTDRRIYGKHTTTKKEEKREEKPNKKNEVMLLLPGWPLPSLSA